MLRESASSIVYHFTFLPNAYAIIKDEQFKLSPSFIHDAESRVDKKLYYLSTTRSRHGHYHRGNSNGVLFTLDGDVLNQKYKSTPIDYWSSNKYNPNEDEMEDRILSDEPYIPINNVVKQIDILLDDNTKKHSRKITLFIYLYAKKNGIPVYVYTNNKDLKMNKKSNALTLDEIKDTVYGDKTDRHISRINFNDVESFIRIYYYPYDKLTTEDMKVYHDLIKNPDTFQRIKNDILRSQIKGSNHYKRIGEMIREVGVRSFEDLYEYLKKKITKEKNEREKQIRYEHNMKTYKDNKELYNHIVNVLDGEEKFNRSLLPEEDERAVIVMDKALRVLDNLDIISERAKLIWFDDYGITQDALIRLFDIDVN